MPLFSIEFQISSRIEVEADDEDDAVEYVKCMGIEQLLKWVYCGTNVKVNPEVVISSVCPAKNIVSS